MTSIGQIVAFYLFAAILVFSSMRVVIAKNSVHAVLFLVLSFFTAAALWLLIGAEFLAIALVLIYVGAVMVLFLFVVMMLDVDLAVLKSSLSCYAPVTTLIGLLMLAEMITLVLAGGYLGDGEVLALQDSSNVKQVGMVLYSEHIYSLEVAAVILLVAIVTAISLTLSRRGAVKTQDPDAQMRVLAKDRLRIVDKK